MMNKFQYEGDVRHLLGNFDHRYGTLDTATGDICEKIECRLVPARRVYTMGTYSSFHNDLGHLAKRNRFLEVPQPRPTPRSRRPKFSKRATALSIPHRAFKYKNIGSRCDSYEVGGSIVTRPLKSRQE